MARLLEDIVARLYIIFFVFFVFFSLSLAAVAGSVVLSL